MILIYSVIVDDVVMLLVMSNFQRCVLLCFCCYVDYCCCYGDCC